MLSQDDNGFSLRRSEQDAKYHQELIDRYFDSISRLLATSPLLHIMEALQGQYVAASNTLQMSIVAFALSQDVPFEARSLRTKLVLLLHTSNLYDLRKARNLLDTLKGLDFERAIIYAKVNLRRSARFVKRVLNDCGLQLGVQEQTLQILATTLRDLVASEAYCSHAGTGDVLGPKNVRELLQAISLPVPSTLLRKDGRRKAACGPSPLPASPLAEKESQRRELLALLIRITLSQSATAPEEQRVGEQARASHVIETQGIRLSAVEMLQSIPDEWPLALMDGFVTRSLRRSLHARYEQKLVKALLQGQMVNTSIRYFEVTEALGGTLAEEAGDDDGNGEELDEKGVVYLEEAPLAVTNEKAVDLF